LVDFRFKRKFKAENRRKPVQVATAMENHGKNLYIKVPRGTVVKNSASGKIIADLSEEKQEELILRGGKGGKGNSHFATSTRQAPRFAEDGEKGKEIEVILELKLLADVGLVGFPNVRKINIFISCNISNS